MAFEGFAFSDQTSELTDTEFSLACDVIDGIERCLDVRDRLIASGTADHEVIVPDAGWHPDTQPSFEIDGSTHNMMTSFELVMRRDRDIIRKLRLYGQAFTGYQLATLDFASRRPWIAEKLPENLDDILRLLVGAPDQSVFDYVSVANALPEELRARPPAKFGEIGWLMDGTIVNYDTYSYQERLCLLFENGVINHLRELEHGDEPLLIVEIGGGFGGLAYHLFRALQRPIRYVIVDLPESLVFSAIYCQTLFPSSENLLVDGAKTGNSPFVLPATEGFTFVPNHLLANMDLGHRHADLVINTLSMSEMSDAQINAYCKLIQSYLGRTGLFFEQNHQTDHEGPGGFPPQYFKNLRRCKSALLPDSFPAQRGDANIWVNAG